jgi:hypothetical protein
MVEAAGFWLFQVPNFLLAAAIYTLLGRYVLSIFFRPDSTAVIWKVFCQVTDPIVNAIGAITPRVVPPPIVVLFAVVWLMMARIALFIFLRASGLLTSG